MVAFDVEVLGRFVQIGLGELDLHQGLAIVPLVYAVQGHLEVRIGISQVHSAGVDAACAVELEVLQLLVGTVHALAHRFVEATGLYGLEDEPAQGRKHRQCQHESKELRKG